MLYNKLYEKFNIFRVGGGQYERFFHKWRQAYHLKDVILLPYGANIGANEKATQVKNF